MVVLGSLIVCASDLFVACYINLLTYLLTYLHLCNMLQDAGQVCYDLKYALRLCAEHGLHRACVHIYTTMGLYDEAVDLALQFDTELAKQNADKPEDNEELKKKLWLKIARHVVEKEKDIEHAMEFLQECPLLKIEDILPFFPDFVTIDNFKDAICTSLQEYNRHIEALKTEMDDATASAREIRAEINGFRNRYAVVQSQDKCSACGYPLMMRAFYLFPCAHKFHADCLVAEVLPHLPASVSTRASELQRRIAAAAHNDPSPTHASLAAASSATSPAQQEQSLKEELDKLVASECVYCGDVMIRMVDKPFVTDEDYESVIHSWL